MSLPHSSPQSISSSTWVPSRWTMSSYKSKSRFPNYARTGTLPIPDIPEARARFFHVDTLVAPETPT